MKKQKTILRRLLVFVLALALLMPVAGPALVPSVAAVTQQEIDQLKKNANDIAAKKKDIQNQLKSIRADKSKALNSKELLEDQIDLTQKEIDNIQAQINAYGVLIAEKEGQLTQLEAQGAEGAGSEEVEGQHAALVLDGARDGERGVEGHFIFSVRL